MKQDTNTITGVSNAYTFPPYQLKATAEKIELQFLFIIKAMVSVKSDETHYRLYRCGWDGTPNSSSSPNEYGVPQGMGLTGTAEAMQEIARALFPVLITGGAIPDPFEYGELENGTN